ncbi:hypothetical protein E8F11_25845 [Pseudomonas sp. BN417]|nr:hypothetical protein [Pseudomonas sp. BN417]
MPTHGFQVCKKGGAATPPLQEAERNRCAGGRAAWMPREACGAMDGPSRRAPGAMMERGKSGAAGPGCRGKRFASFWATAKGSCPGGRNKNPKLTRQWAGPPDNKPTPESPTLDYQPSFSQTKKAATSSGLLHGALRNQRVPRRRRADGLK